MPSHLDEPHKAAERKRALQSGLIVEEDIQGNAHADKLADDGAKQHTSNEMYVTAAKIRHIDHECGLSCGSRLLLADISSDQPTDILNRKDEKQMIILILFM